jgi:hypothetical protein
METFSGKLFQGDFSRETFSGKLFRRFYFKEATQVITRAYPVVAQSYETK